MVCLKYSIIKYLNKVLKNYSLSPIRKYIYYNQILVPIQSECPLSRVMPWVGWCLLECGIFVTKAPESYQPFQRLCTSSIKTCLSLLVSSKNSTCIPKQRGRQMSPRKWTSCLGIDTFWDEGVWSNKGSAFLSWHNIQITYS